MARGVNVLPLVPETWDIDRDRACFLLALCEVVPETHHCLREMFFRLHATGKGTDARATLTLARRWARNFRLLDAANPRLPATWVVNAVYFNFMRWHDEMEDPCGEEDEQLLRQCMGKATGAKRTLPPAPDFVFIVPWYMKNEEENEERLVSWEDVLLPDICITPDWYPGETRQQARARILAEFQRALDSWLDRYEAWVHQRGWRQQRQRRRPRQHERSSPDHLTRHHEWLALYLAARMRWAEIADLYTTNDLENPVEAETVRKGAVRLAERIHLYVPLGRRRRE